MAAPRAELAIEVFCHRIRRAIGSLYAVLNGVDVLAFTGGIGENSPTIRARICQDMDALVSSSTRNRMPPFAAGSPDFLGRPRRSLGGATNEELLVAEDTARVAGGV